MKMKLRNTLYPIEIGSGVVNQLLPYLQKNNVYKVVLLCDERLTQARKRIRKQFVKTAIDFHEIPLTAGESLKEFQSIYPLYAELLKLKADRETVLIALGGGSIGDAIGFIAATYVRGIRWIGVPTTLLAQVDSSIGGKTGINHDSGKNLIGTFHQPSLVLCDPDFLETLSPREIASGVGEIVKYAITFDPKFFSYLTQNLEKLLNLDAKLTQTAIEKSLQFKVDAVEADEFDRKGVREVLNFGHTFGHALETLTEYETYQHGEAVVWGMRFAVALSLVRGHLDESSAVKIETLLDRIPVPALPKRLIFDEILQTMKKDKKSSRNLVRFVLLKKIGKTVSDREVQESDLRAAFQRMKS
jgi:3-dehydroquinate synthase